MFSRHLLNDIDCSFLKRRIYWGFHLLSSPKSVFSPAFYCSFFPFLQRLYFLSFFMASSRVRRPPSYIRSVTIFNNFNIDTQQWIPTILPLNSWVMLQKRKRQRQSGNHNDYKNSFKGRVIDFKVVGTCVKEVRIQHAYMHSEIKLRTWPKGIPLHRPNCKIFLPDMNVRAQKFCNVVCYVLENVFVLYRHISFGAG